MVWCDPFTVVGSFVELHAVYFETFKPLFSLLLIKSSLMPPQPVQCAPATLDMDEESQLQLALTLSKEEHQQVMFPGVTWAHVDNYFPL